MTIQKEQPDRVASVMAGEERRRSQRVIIRVPVTVQLTVASQVVKVPAQTAAVNVHGAMLICARSFDANTQLEVVNNHSNERITARVTRTPRESAEGFLIPVEFSKAAPSFWQISFPSTDWKPSDS